MTKTRASFQAPSDLWHDFLVWAKMNNTTASKEIRNFLRQKLGKTEREE